MSYKSLRYFLFIVSSIALITSFQNCGQGGNISQAETINSKAATDPLVVDVVEDMEMLANDEVARNDNVADDKKDDKKDGKKDFDRPVQDKKECERDLEEIFEKYKCDNSGHGKKVLVCHFPPGNPAAKKTICVSEDSLKGHKDHGHSLFEHQDHLGPCVQDPVIDEPAPIQDSPAI